MPSATLIKHPLVQASLARLRNRETPSHEFRALTRNLTTLIMYEAFRDCQTREVQVETPLTTASCRVLERDISLVLILRAGLGMMDGFLELLPQSSVGYIGLARNEKTLRPSTYYFKLPPGISRHLVAVADPMLATGGSAVAAIDYLKKEGVSQIKFICLLASPEGLQVLQNEHPDVQVYAAAIDDKLNTKGYIIPGLGDAGDRLFGTE